MDSGKTDVRLIKAVTATVGTRSLRKVTCSLSCPEAMRSAKALGMLDTETTEEICVRVGNSGACG